MGWFIQSGVSLGTEDGGEMLVLLLASASKGDVSVVVRAVCDADGRGDVLGSFVEVDGVISVVCGVGLLFSGVAAAETSPSPCLCSVAVNAVMGCGTSLLKIRAKVAGESLLTQSFVELPSHGDGSIASRPSRSSLCLLNS